jgi:hypothetical protein
MCGFLWSFGAIRDSLYAAGGITIRLNVRIARVAKAWDACTALRRSLIWAALIVIFITGSLEACKKSRMFHAEFEQVWIAGAGVAKEAFYHNRHSKSGGQVTLLPNGGISRILLRCRFL